MTHRNEADSAISRGRSAASEGGVGTSCTVTMKALVTLWTPSPTAIRTIWALGPCASVGVQIKLVPTIWAPAGPTTNLKFSVWAGRSASLTRMPWM